MKKVLVILSLFVFASCSSIKSDLDVVTFQAEGFESTLFLNDVSVEPAHAINGIEPVLPKIIRSVGARYGFTILPKLYDDEKPVLDVFLHRKQYMKNFENYESVTLIMTIKEGETIISNTIYTQDSQTTLDSFAQIYDLFEKVFPPMQKEYKKAQKELSEN